MSQSSAGDLLAELGSAGIRVWVEAGQLRFRAPQKAMTPARRDALRARKDEIVAHLEGAADSIALVTDPPARHDPFPVTDVQSAYLLGRGETFAYGGVACHGYGELTYAELDPERMTAAWRALIDRHDMLRAVVEADGAQRVLPEVPAFEVPVIDLRGRADAVVEAGVAAVRAEMDHRVHTSDQWPLFDARITLADGRAVQHVSIDFLIADFISVQVVLDELHRLYHRPDEPLPALEVTFRDYQLAERTVRNSARYERDKKYWLGRADDLPAAPELPTVARPTESDGRFRRWETRLSPEVWEQLRQRAGRHGISPSGAVLAAYCDTIAAWSRRPRFTLDITLLNRMPLHPQVNSLVGDFTSVELLAVDADPTRRFRDRARDLQAQLWDDMDHRTFSGIEVMREIARRSGAEAALFPVVFTSAIGIADAGAAADGAPMGQLGYGISQTPQVWIDCQNIERDGGMVSNWDVREEVFPPGVIEDMFTAYEALLRKLASGDAAWDRTGHPAPPERQLARRAQVNRTDAPLPAGMLHDRVVLQALTTPDRVAVISGDQTMSYAELLGRAAGVAEVLAAAGCRRQELVAVVMDRGWEQVVGVLGALLAGCVYVPVDTAQPAGRLRIIISGAGIRLALTQSWVDGEGWAEDIQVVAVDTVAAAEPQPTEGAGDPEDLAYIIHTSGSTGAPKGVMINHRGALNTVLDINERFAVGPEDRVLGLSRLGFDLSVYDIFGPLSVGGTLVLPDWGRRGDPSHWADLVSGHGVSVWNSVPAQLQMLNDYLSAAPMVTLPSLRLAMLSGDWIPVPLPDQIRARVPGLRLVSLGGATEASIWSIWYPIDEVSPQWRSIPYGRPLTNQSFHVLDAGWQPRPDLVAGDLYIGGVGLALGYLNDRERTAERFVEHPETGQWLYRTGDVGRYLPDGDIEFLGREDLQVKIRGYRIELAEIEAVLQSHPTVAGAAVIVDGDKPLERRLAAFVEPATRAVPPGAVELERHSADRIGAQACAAADTTLSGVDRERYLNYAHHLDRVALPAMIDAFRAGGLFTASGRRHTVAEILAGAGVAARHHRLVRRWLHALVSEGLLDVDIEGRYRLTAAAEAGDTASAWHTVGELADADDRELLDYFRNSTAQLPALLRGDDDPLALLFPQGRVDVSQRLYEDTLFNKWANRAAGELVRRLADQRVGPGALRILEVGAGAGGTTAAVLAAIEGLDVDYLCTDLSPFFIGELKSRFGDRPGLRLQVVDLDEDLVCQGLAANSFDVVVAGDVLHATSNVDRALERLRGVIAPQGWLVACEMTQDHYQIMTSLELLVRVDEATADFTDRRQGTEQVFLDRKSWLDALTAAGGQQPLCLPEPDGFIAELGMCVLAARFKTDRVRIPAGDLASHLAEHLPEYMVPAVIQVIDALPVNANGKIDRTALRRRLPRPGAAAGTTQSGPTSDLERRLGALWAQALRVPQVGRDDNLFELGGDSLVAAQITGRILEEIPESAGLFFDQLLRQVLEQPTVAALAAHVEAGAAAQAAARPEVAAPAGSSAGGLTALDSTTDGTPWILVHGCTGTFEPYLGLVPALAGSGPVLGLTAGTTTDGDLPRLAARHARSIAEAGHPAVRLVGHGLGASLALEIARALTDSGQQIDELVLVSPWRPTTLPDPAVVYVAETGGGEPDDAFVERLAATVRHEPTLYAGDITVARPLGYVPYDAESLEFWADLCLGDTRTVDVEGGHLDALGERSVTTVTGGAPGSAQ